MELLMKINIKLIVIFLTSLNLISCGGGGEETASSTPTCTAVSGQVNTSAGGSNGSTYSLTVGNGSVSYTRPSSFLI